MEEKMPSGWVKPHRSRTLPELKELIAAKREELRALETEAASLSEDERLQAIAQARNIMRAHQLSYDDIASR
jgi:hypothetical protein